MNKLVVALYLVILAGTGLAVSSGLVSSENLGSVLVATSDPN